VVTLLKKAKYDLRTFELAKYLSSKQLGFGPVYSPALQQFAASVLSNKEDWPTHKGGRPYNAGSLMDICRYIITLQIVAGSDVKLNRADETGGVSACDIVARAFSDEGYLTTRGRVKSICYDTGFARFRAAANYLLNGEFIDLKAHMDVRNPKNGPQFLRNVPFLFFKT
jgi:hypothetical protein